MTLGTAVAVEAAEPAAQAQAVAHATAADRVGSAEALALAYLAGKQDALGRWTDFFTPAGSSDEWVTGFVATQLAQTGLPDGLTMARRAWQHLEGARPTDSGWGYAEQVPIDADSTAWVVQLATALGVSETDVLTRAKAYLAAAVRPNGVITYPEADPIRQFLGLSDRVSFAGWQLPHLCVAAPLGEHPAFRERIVRTLETTQRADGAWAAYWWFDDLYATAFAAEALAAVPTAAATGALDRAVQWGYAQWLTDDRTNAFRVALFLRLLVAGQHPAASECAETLLDLQQETGRWRAGARLRIPRPDDEHPVPQDAAEWNRWFGSTLSADADEDAIMAATFGIFSLDQASVFTTALAVGALARYARHSGPLTPPLAVEKADYRVSAADRAHFAQEGFVLLRDVFSPEIIEAVEPVISRAVYALNVADSADTSQADQKAFLRSTGIWEADAEARAFILSPKLAAIAGQLLGTPQVRLFHDQAFYKQHGQGATPWHQDRYYWPLATDRVLTLWIPLVPIDDAIGPLRFLNGTHRLGSLGNLHEISQSPEKLDAFLAQHHTRVSTVPPLAPGDITAHWGWTVHGAAPNTSDRTRKVLTIVFYAEGTTLQTSPADAGADAFDQQAAYIRRLDQQRWFPGRSDGDKASSRFTPLFDAYRSPLLRFPAPLGAGWGVRLRHDG